MPDGVPYRTDFPLDAIKRAVELVRGGELENHVHEFAWCAYQVESFALGYFLPWPEGVPRAAAVPDPAQVRAVQELHDVLAAAHASARPSGFAEPLAGRLPARAHAHDHIEDQPVGTRGLRDWIGILLPLLMELLKRFLPAQEVPGPAPR